LHIRQFTAEYIKVEGNDVRIAIFLGILFLPLASLAQDQPKQGAAIDRGKYIVNQIAMCSECHTPRNAAGQLQTTAYLLGAPVPVPAPPFANINWALKAPAIAGLNGYSEQQGIRLLMEGITRDGRQPNPPMPRFRMNRSDAAAVVAYLKSLN
jgi:mono/diheme cytochrome c family protein